MNKFTIVTPADLAHASALLAAPNHRAIAGGVDVVDLMKQDIASPATLVNLKGLPELQGIKFQGDGSMRLGALVKLHEVATNPEIQKRFTAISDAAGEAATPQIRNLGTVGGNLLQRPRCWYFRNPLTVCLKKGGDKCYSIGGLNRYHAILGGGPSYIVHPSNLAPALVAFGASARIAGPAGERTVALEKFFTLPEVDPKRENDLRTGEIITEVIVPAPAPGTRSIYLEVREKQSFDWPLERRGRDGSQWQIGSRRADRDGRSRSDSVARAGCRKSDHRRSHGRRARARRRRRGACDGAADVR